MGFVMNTTEVHENLATTNDCRAGLRYYRNVKEKLHAHCAKLAQQASSLEEGNPLKAAFDRQIAMYQELEKQIASKEEELKETLTTAQTKLQSARQLRDRSISEEFQLA